MNGQEAGIEENEMAQKFELFLVDDLDGGKADETVRFSFDGRSYEIDLSAANAERLRASLQPFVAAARNARPADRRSAGRRTTGSRARSAEIRTWARTRGINLSERGRIPAAVVELYDAAH
jgi:hypothetical protein